MCQIAPESSTDSSAESLADSTDRSTKDGRNASGVNGSCDKQNTTTIPPGLDSGDVVLFNRRCTSMPFIGASLCIVAKLFSNSQWDHVGVVIRHPATGELLFLEADFGGVKLRSLEKRVARSKSKEIAVRRLSVVRTASMREKFYAFAQEMLGRPYEMGTGSMLARVTDPLAKQEKERLNALLLDKRAQVDEISRELEASALTTFQRRLLQNERDRVLESCHQIHQRLVKELVVSSAEKPSADSSPNADDVNKVKTPPQVGESDLSRVFCSELVAAAYQRADLLGSYPPPYYYNPKDFSSQQTHPPGVHLLKSARLGNELYIRKSTRSSRESPLSSTKKAFRSVQENDKPSRDARNTIRDSLRRTPMYGMVPDEYKRNHLLKSFRARIIEHGDLVFEQGQYGDQFFVVDSGVLERFMQKGEEDSILVNTMGAGSSFGFTGFIFNAPRVSTVRAKERTLLWVLDRQSFELFRDASSDVKSILSTVDNRALRRLMKEHFLFRRLDKLGHNEVSAFFLVKFRAGETVFKQGEPGDNFYIVKSGELERHIRHPKRTRNGDHSESRVENDEDSLVKTLEPGQSFGELSLMYNAPRGGTVRARTDAECWAISAESFHRLNLSGGTQHLRAIFNKNTSVFHDGEAYMKRDDLLRFAGVGAFPDVDRERLAALLVSLVACNRQRDPVPVWENGKAGSENLSNVSSRTLQTPEEKIGNDEESDEGVLMDFWEFVRFDIVLNQPSAERVFAFRLADQNNSGFISLDEMENLLQSYADIDKTAHDMLTTKNSPLRKVFGKDGSRTLAAREFYDLSDDILPPLFVKDVKMLTQHMLNMDIVGTHLSREHEKEELSFMEPDGGLSVIGSQFMTSSSRNGIFSRIGSFSKPKPQPYTRYEENSSPTWAPTIDWGHLISVGVSGAVSRTAVAPLERLKILMQTSALKQYPLSWTASLRAMIQQDFSIARALFRGNGANVIRIMPSAAIQLIIVDQLRNMSIMRKLMNGGVWPSSPAATSSSDHVLSGGARTRAVEAVLIGGIAGMVAAMVTYPFDFVRGRLSVQRRGFEPYRGTLHSIHEVIRKDGFRALYRGLGPSLAGVFPYVGLSFGIYETLRPVLPKKNDKSGVPTTSSSIVCGMISMATGQLAAFPLDTCRRRMQVSGFTNDGHIKATSFVQTWREIGRQMGWRGYFRGVLPNLLKIAPASAVSFVAYEKVRGGIKMTESSTGGFFPQSSRQGESG